MITKTDIIVLWSIKYGESSLIATVLSEEHGKLPLMVRGGRKPKSGFSGMIQSGNLLHAVYYYKQTRSVQTLSETSYVTRLDTLHQDIEKMAMTMSSMELIGQLLHEGEVNESIFQFAKRFLVWLDQAGEVIPATFPYLQIRLAQLIGLELQIHGVKAGDEEGYLNIDGGLVTGRPKSDKAVRLSQNQLRFIVNSTTSRSVSTLKEKLDGGERTQLVRFLDDYFRYHLDGLRPRKSDAIFDQILKE